MNEIIKVLRNVGAIITDGHFVGTSGLHFDTYVNKDFLFPHIKETQEVGELFAERYKDQDIGVVVGPAMGGIILAQWVAYNLSKISGKEVLAVYSEKSPDGDQFFQRGYGDFVKGKRILVVEDIITTGGSLLKAIKAVKEAGGNIIGVCAILNKNENLDRDMFGVPFEALDNLYVKTYEMKDCPLCKAGVPINTKVGHGKRFLESNK